MASVRVIRTGGFDIDAAGWVKLLRSKALLKPKPRSRPFHHREEEGSAMVATMPVVDMSPFLADPREGPRKVAREVSSACLEMGAFYLSNHEVPTVAIRDLYEIAKQFFALPQEKKSAFHISKSEHHRGYFPVGEENAKGNAIADLKEGFDMALELPPDDPDVIAKKPLHGPNVWPTEPPTFRPILEAYYSEMRRLSEQLCEIFAIGLGLPTRFFLDKVSKPLAQFRLLRYPPQPRQAEGHAIGAGTHTDYGIVTVLWQDEVGGLQIQTRDGAWVDVLPQEGMFICHIGDALQRWTNDEWQATVHRVVNASGRERYSAAFFFDPDYDCLIKPLSQFVNASRPARYPPVTMGEYVAQSFDETFTYRLEERAR
jgi:isopenicillin N synthase-like dioxygenase